MDEAKGIEQDYL